MPTAPPRLCTRCRVAIRGAACPTCRPPQRASADQRRLSSNQRGYDSNWRRAIRPAYIRAHPLCVLCGSLTEVPDHWPRTRKELLDAGVPDPDAHHRMRPLCLDCHHRYGLSFKPWVTAEDRLNTQVTVIAGPPCAGKNTYINSHAHPGDIVIDYDQIMTELTGQPSHHHDKRLTARVHAIRDQRITDLLSSGQRGWIINSGPRRAARHRYNTNVTLLLPDIDTARQRARHERPPAWMAYITDWYAQYEPDDRDIVVTT